MKFVELDLKQLYPEQEITRFVTIDKCLEDFDVCVVLGAPGSGKSELLKNANKKVTLSELLSVREFILNTDEKEIEDKPKTYFIDGLDEYRSLQTVDKVFVTADLARQIQEAHEGSRFVISCREMDWYGDSDKLALEDKLKTKKVCVLQIQPLSKAKQFEFVNHRIGNEEKSSDLLDRLEPYGITSNPQMLSMILDLFDENENFIIKNKTELYEQFINFAKETNSIHKKESNNLNSDERIELLGYLAFYYFFADINKFDNEILLELKLDEKDYKFTKEKLSKLINTKLFQDKTIVHRTVFEYALAKYIYEKKWKTGEWSENRILALFTKGNYVHSEYRGVYSWLCSFTKAIGLIRVDPYNQLLYGDNSVFSVDLKKQVIEVIEQYAKNVSPYFYSNKHELQFISLYEQELDEFLLQKLEDSKNYRNHFGLFISEIISVSTHPSDYLKEKAKLLIFDKDVSLWYKQRLVHIYDKQDSFLVQVLDAIVDGGINDEKSDLMNTVLNIVYPEVVTPKTVIKYLKNFTSDVFGYGEFLYKTPVDEKKELIDLIFQHCNVKKKFETIQKRFPNSIAAFVEDYFLDTIFEYRKAYSAKEIFDVLMHFWQKYYKRWEILDFKSYLYMTKRQLDKKTPLMEELADELYKEFVKKWWKESEEPYRPLEFSNFFGVANPKNKLNHLLKLLSFENTPEQNLRVFRAAMCYRTEVNKVQLEKIAKEYKFLEEFNRYYSKEPMEWEIEDKKREKARKDKRIHQIRENEEFFQNKSKEALESDFSIMHWFAMHFFVGGVIESSKVLVKSETFDRLYKIFSSYYLSKSVEIVNRCTLLSLCKESPTADRSIDQVVYTSISFNKWKQKEIPMDDLHKYLFVLCVLEEHVGNIIQNDFLKSFELQHKNASLEVLKEYIELMYDSYLAELKPFLMIYINSETDDKALKNIIRLFVHEGRNVSTVLLHRFLVQYGFKLSKDELNQICDFENDEKITNIVKGLIKLFEDDSALEKSEIYVLFDMFRRYGNEYESFKKIESDKKISLIHKMMNGFKTEKAVDYRDDFNETVMFLRTNSLGLFTLEELEKLRELRVVKNPNNEEDFWLNEIKQKIYDLNSINLSTERKVIKISAVKSLVKDNSITSYSDFYSYIVDEFENIIIEIEGEEFNEKKLFYNVGSPKIENDCRDIIAKDLKNRNIKKIDIEREFYKANNRVDMRILSLENPDWIIYFEAKRDSNGEWKSGLVNQLIGKYLSVKVPNGIYLIFKFGKKNKNKIVQEIESTIPPEKKGIVKVLCVDLSLNKPI